MNLSVVIITKNEEKNIRRCLESVKWADEIVMIDSESTDGTVSIASEYGAKVFSPEWRGYGPAKQDGVARANGRWVLSLDADEVVSKELGAEVRDIVSNGSKFNGYYVTRKTNFLGRWILHCGWYPDHVLRLFKKSEGDFNDAVIHERAVVNDPVGYLRGEILHYCYPTLELYLDKFNHYTTIGASEAFRKRKRAGVFAIMIKPMASFVRHYFVKQGFRDGLEGFVLSVMSSVAVLVKYMKLRNLYRNNESEK